MTEIKLQIQIVNEKQTRRLLRNFPKKADRTLAVGIRQAVRVLYRESQKDRNLRFKNPTGATKASFRRGRRTHRATGSIGPRTPYAKYVSAGTSRLRPRRWVIGGRVYMRYNAFMERILHGGRREVNKVLNKQVAKFITGEVGRYINR